MYVENISCLIFLLFNEYENFLTTKISQITVRTYSINQSSWLCPSLPPPSNKSSYVPIIGQLAISCDSGNWIGNRL